MFTTTHNVLPILCSGAITGMLGAMLGIGGGVFLIPVLVLLLGVPMHYAVATSIVSVIATSSAAASSNVERGTANMPLGMVLEIATVLGAIGGGLTASFVSARLLEALFALVVLPTAYVMWRGKREEEWGEKEMGSPAGDVSPLPVSGLLAGSYYDDAAGEQVNYSVKRLGAGMAVSFVAGNLSGLLGIGGGVFKVPAMHLLCGVPMKAAAATSNFMIGVTAAASAFLYYGRGEVRPALTAAVVLGVLAGTRIGLSLSRRAEGGLLRKIFAVLLFGVAVQMMFRAVQG